MTAGHPPLSVLLSVLWAGLKYKTGTKGGGWVSGTDDIVETAVCVCDVCTKRWCLHVVLNHNLPFLGLPFSLSLGDIYLCSKETLGMSLRSLHIWIWIILLLPLWSLKDIPYLPFCNWNPTLSSALCLAHFAPTDGISGVPSFRLYLCLCLKSHLLIHQWTFSQIDFEKRYKQVYFLHCFNGSLT